MLNLRGMTIDFVADALKKSYQRTYNDLDVEFGNIVEWTARLALENISNSDALYHDVEHTVMVVLAGQAILEGKHLIEGGVTPKDWMLVTLALLCHDIGYVRGVCREDKPGEYATGQLKETVKLPAGATDVSLTPYHVDRSKRFVQERFGSGLLKGMESVIDADVVASYIEYTRFPIPDGEIYQNTKNFGGLVRAADFIGQLGDPNYQRKIPALFYEFEETGVNKEFGYKSPADLRQSYAKFYWGVVRPYIGDALRYLKVTQKGKQWIASLHSHVFEAEHLE